MRPTVLGTAKPTNWMADWRMTVGRSGSGARTTDMSDVAFGIRMSWAVTRAAIAQPQVAPCRDCHTSEKSMPANCWKMK